MTYLDTVVAGRNTSILYLHGGRRMCEFAFGVRARALIPLEFAAHLELQPARVLAVQEVIHIQVDDSRHFCCVCFNSVVGENDKSFWVPSAELLQWAITGYNYC